MNLDYSFDPSILNTVLGGQSTLDIPRLNVQSLDQAKNFVKAYGYDLDVPEDRARLENYYRRAVTFIRTELLDKGEEIPETIADPAQLQELAYLLIYASTQDQRENSLRRWSCAILRVMHVLAHLDNDLFTRYSSEIQDQILKPFQDYIVSDPASGIRLGGPLDPDPIPLTKFEVKAFKTSSSSVLKLLAKREAIAFGILDKVGVRFVTKTLFDSFRVIRFLLNHNIISFPHIIPDQTNNTLYPFNIFLETMESLTKEQDLTSEKVDELLKAKLKSTFERAEYKEKPNIFTSKDYRFIKFISRRLIKVPEGFSFFYPFEIQILDYETFLHNMTGQSSHDAYKERQKAMARLRVLGFGPTSPSTKA